MSSRAVGAGRRDDSFWRDFPEMTDYFSPGIVPILAYLGLGSKEVMHEFGEMVGRNAADKLSDESAQEMLGEFCRLWDEAGIGKLAIESRDPLVLEISDCTVCGQLQGSGEMYECAFHEGFFQGALGAKAGRRVSVHQQTNHEGESGTWCRKIVTDIAV